MISGNQPRFLISLPEFQVLGFSGSESVNQLYSFQLELVTSSTSLTWEELVGQPAELLILGPGQTRRTINGLIARLELAATLPKRSIFQAQLVPPHYRLTLKRRLRAFQDLTTPEIVSQVLGESGISGDSLDWRLRESYAPRNYCAQYRESDLDFISRLLEEEGINYHFEHRENELITVFSDHGEAFQPILDAAGQAVPAGGSAPRVIFSSITTMTDDQEFVSTFRAVQQLRSGAVQLRDYNFKRPRLDLKGEALGLDPTLEVYDFPGEFTDNELGQRLARVRLQEQEQGRETGGGDSNCLRLAPGQRFVLGGDGPAERHPRAELNQEHLLLQVTHTGHQGGVLEEEGDYSATVYGNSFTVQPAAVPLRPARTTGRPAALGTQTATVVGPKGDEIYVDGYGRVKLRFHWDREGKSTSWVRVSQAWAGASFGSQFLPRVGQEVLVGFLEGDPDRPLVIGRVYNGEQLPPYALPAHKTRSVIRSNASPQNASAQDLSSGLVDDYHANPGYNELSFEDAKGGEEIYLQAERDYNAVVENDRTTLVKHDRYEEVGNLQQLKVGRNQTVQVKESSKLQAQSILFEAKEKLTLKVGGSSFELSPASFQLLGADLISSASGLQEVKGAAIKLNAEPPLVMGSASAMSAKEFNWVLDSLRKNLSKSDFEKFVELGELRYSDGVVIKGSNKFQEMAKRDLDRLKTTPTGKALLQSLDDSGKSVIIMDSESDGSYIYTDTGGLRKAVGTPGPGSTAVVTYSTNKETTWGTEDWQKLPREVVLGHELVHANDAVYGTWAPGEVPNDSCPDPTDPTKMAMVPAAEAETSGFPPYHTKRFSENKIRAEWSPKLPPRLYY